MTNFTSILHFFLLSCTSYSIHAFRTSQILPTSYPISQQEISQRLGLKQADPINNAGVLSIGSGPSMAYTLTNEHEVVCPVSGAHQGILCTALLPSIYKSGENDDAESIVNNHELVSQAILSGSLAASIRNRCKDGNSIYYLPYVITLVESLMADEMESINLEEMVFNSDGLETNEILMDLSDDELTGEESGSVKLYATNTHSDQLSATSDVYLFPPEKTGKVWRFSVDYKVATINLRSITSFGDRDSTTPLRPDVWLKNDSY